MIPPFLLAAFSNIWVRRAALAVVVLIALLAVRQHYIDMGKAKGETQEKQQVAGGNEQARAADRDQLSATLEKLNARIERSEASQLALQSALTMLASQRAQVDAHVQAYTPEQLAEAYKKAFGEGVPGVQNAVACSEKLSLCDQQRQKLEAKADEAQNTANIQRDRYDALSTYTIGLEREYTQLYNFQARPKRAARCLFLWRCKSTRIPTPDPAQLRRPTQAAQ